MYQTYRLDKPENIIELAQEVKWKVYWGHTFILEEEEIRYSEFWDICKASFDEGYTILEMYDEGTGTDKIKFIKG